MKWSDGSLQLFVGSEAFDVLQHPFDATTNFIYAKCKEEETGAAPDDAPAPGSLLRKCQGAITQKMTFQLAQGIHYPTQPHSTAQHHGSTRTRTR